MPLSTMQFSMSRHDRVASVQRRSAQIGRLIMFVALAWMMLASATVTATYACADRENGVRLAVERSVSAVHSSAAAANASQAVVGIMDCNGEASGSAHCGCCTGGMCCSTCSLALDVAVDPLREPPEVLVDFVVPQERPRPVDPLPGLRPPIRFA